MSLRHRVTAKLISTSRALFCAALLVTTNSNAWAQSWSTPETCTVTDELLAEYTDQNIAAQSDIVNGLGRFWEVKSPGGAVSHLWGTYHSSARQFLRLPPQVLFHLETAQLVAVETDYRFHSRQEIDRAFDYEGWWQDPFRPTRPITFFPDADPRIGEWVDVRLASLGYDADTREYLTRGGVFSLLLSDPCEDFSSGLIPYQDQFIMTLGYIHGAEVIGLEPRNAMMKMLNNPQNSDYAEAMITAYGAYLQPHTDPSDRAWWMSLYLRGQIGLMVDEDSAYLGGLLGPDSAKAISLTNDYLLTQRNKVFLGNAMEALNAGGAFIAIGTFHLPGETGLVEMLRKEGFEVRRIAVQGEDEQ